MIINSVESYCNGENDGVARIGNLNRMDGIRSDNFFTDINSPYNNTSNHNGGLSIHPEETVSGECRNAFSSYNQGRNSLQPQDQFVSCFEKQRQYSDFRNAGTNESTFGCLNQQTPPVISACSAALTQSLSPNSVPSSPAVTIISVPSPVELKPNVEELDCFRRQNHMQQGNIMSTPPQSSSPEMDNVMNYFQPSPPAQTYQQRPSEQVGGLQQGGNCYGQQMSAVNFPSSQQCISSIAESQTSLTDLNSFPQYRSSVSGATSSSYILSEANSTARFESANYPGYLHQSQDTLPLSENSELPYSVGFALHVESQQTNLCNDSSDQQSLARYDGANYEPSVQFQSNTISQCVTNKQRLRSARKGGKELLAAKVSDNLRDEQLIDLSVRDLNRLLRGLR